MSKVVYVTVGTVVKGVFTPMSVKQGCDACQFSFPILSLDIASRQSTYQSAEEAAKVFSVLFPKQMLDTFWGLTPAEMSSGLSDMYNNVVERKHDETECMTELMSQIPVKAHFVLPTGEVGACFRVSVSFSYTYSYRPVMALFDVYIWVGGLASFDSDTIAKLSNCEIARLKAIDYKYLSVAYSSAMLSGWVSSPLRGVSVKWSTLHLIIITSDMSGILSVADNKRFRYKLLKKLVGVDSSAQCCNAWLKQESNKLAKTPDDLVTSVGVADFCNGPLLSFVLDETHVCFGRCVTVHVVK